MSAEFREVFANCGFDRETPTGGPGIVIPQNGVGFVLLDGGRDLKVAPTMNAMLRVDEIKDDQRRHESISNAPYPRSSTEKAPALTLLKSSTLRLFKITANTQPGLGLKIEAVNPTKKGAEATLKVIILKEKRVKVAMRPVQVRDEKGILVNSSDNPIDPKVLLNEMNAIWTPQANVVFELSKIDPITIDQLKPGQPADITNEALKANLMAKKDPNAALTFFMVKRAINKDSKDLGVINSEAGISLISDDRSDSTMAHEAGHFLGSLSESGKFSMRYGHQGTDEKLLMRAGGAGHKIPYEIVTDFNKGYRT
jgi:hypothetical protein